MPPWPGVWVRGERSGMGMRTSGLVSALTRGLWVLIVVGAFALFAPSGAPPPASEPASAAPPAGFTETTVFSGLTNPTVVRFASRRSRLRGREERDDQGLRQPLGHDPDDLREPAARTSTTTGIAACSGWRSIRTSRANPYVYVLYTYDHVLGSASAPPRWGDRVPDAARADLRRMRRQRAALAAAGAGNVMTGSEQVLDRGLVPAVPEPLGRVRSSSAPTAPSMRAPATAPASPSSTGGRTAIPVNPCGDPPTGVGGVQTTPSAEGGALRSQDLRTSGDPATLDGSVIRVDPATGAGLPSNPFAGSADANVRRIIAYGLRNPFRFTFRPGTSELWIRRRRLERLGGDQPHREPDRRDGRELRLAVLRGNADVQNASTSSRSATTCTPSRVRTRSRTSRIDTRTR